MKQVFILSVALACGISVQAQTEQKSEGAKPVRDAVVAQLESALNARDEVALELAKLRAEYAEVDSLRSKLAPTILKLEGKLDSLQTEYDKVLGVVTQIDVQRALATYNESQKAAVEAQATKESAPKVEEVEQPATNPADDFNSLLNERISREAKIKELVANYFAQYNELLALQKRYNEVPTKKEAEEVAALFATKLEALTAIDCEIIAQKWTTIYYDTIHDYNLLMERNGNSDMLQFSRDTEAQARRDVRDLSGKYISDAIMDSVVRKEALIKYEMKLASHLLQTSLVESLLGEEAKLKESGYELSKLSILRRNFILYENIEVKKTAVYSSANPVPKTKVDDYGNIYRIRIASSAQKIAVSKLRNVAPVSYSYIDGEYVYFVGGFRTEQEAKAGVAQLKKIGFKEPEVAVWVDGEYCPTLADMSNVENQYNVEIAGVETLPEGVEAILRAHRADGEIKRVGSTFVLGTFIGLSVAEKVVAEVVALNAEIEAKAVKQNLKQTIE